MAIIGQRLSKLRPGYVNKVFNISTWKGNLRSQAWPRKRGKPKSEYLQSLNDRMKTVVAHLKTLKAREVIPLQEAVDAHNRSVRGFKGAAAIRLRDLMYMHAEGRMLSIYAEPEGPSGPDAINDGRIFMSSAVAQDVSDGLDWLQPRVGSLIVFHNGLWLPTWQCMVGGVFTSVPDGGTVKCCPEASFRGDKVTPESTMSAEERTLQQALNVFSQEEGAIIVRGHDYWKAIPPGPVGYVLAIGEDGVPGWYDPDNLPTPS